MPPAGIGLVLFELSFLLHPLSLTGFAYDANAPCLSSAQLVRPSSRHPAAAAAADGRAAGHFFRRTPPSWPPFTRWQTLPPPPLLFPKTDAVWKRQSGTHRFRPPSRTRGCATAAYRSHWAASPIEAGIRRPFVPEKNMPIWNSSAFIRWVFRSAGRHYCSKASFQQSRHRIFSAQSKKTPRPPASRQRQNPPPPCLPPPSLPDRHFSRPSHTPPAAGKLRCRPVYRRIVYAAAAVLHAGRNQRHRFERRPKNTPDRTRHRKSATERSNTCCCWACRTVRQWRAASAVACATSLRLFFVFKTESSCRLWQPAQTPAALYAHIALDLLSAAYTCFGTLGKLPLFLEAYKLDISQAASCATGKICTNCFIIWKTRVSDMKIILTTSMSGLGGGNRHRHLGRLLKQRGHDIILASSDGPFVGGASIRHPLAMVDFTGAGL